MKDNNADMPASQPLKQSRVGIAATLLAVLATACFCLYVILFVYISSLGPRPIGSTDSLFTILNVTMSAVIILGLIGGVIGIVSLFQKNTRKIFGGIGLLLSALILCGSCGFYVWAMLTPK